MSDFLRIAGSMFTNTWTFLQSVRVPGFPGGVTFAGLFLTLFLIGIGLRILARMIGSKRDSGDDD